MCYACSHPHPATVFYPHEDLFGRTPAGSANSSCSAAPCRNARMLPGVRRILDANAPVVFVPDALPRGQEWATAGVTILRLAQAAWVESGRLAVDTPFIEDVVCKDAPRPAAARTIVFPTPAGATWPEVRIVIGELFA